MLTHAVARFRHGVICLGSLALCAIAAPAGAAGDEISELKRALDEARAALSAQAARIAALQELLDEQRRRIDALAASLEKQQARAAEAGAAETGRAVPRVGIEAASAAPVVDAQAANAQPLLLSPKGTWTFEPSLDYSHVSNNRISIVGFTVLPAITVGLIDVQQVSRDTLTAALGVRYGLAPGLELEARVPYVYRNDSFVTRPLNTSGTADTSSSLSAQGIGDLEAAVRYQPAWRSSERLGVIGELRVKSRTGKGPLEVPLDPQTGQPSQLATGTGFWSVQPGVTFVAPTDPAVVYGGLRYQWNVARDYGGSIGRYDPGDGAGFNLGVGLALNDVSSLSIGYDHLWLARNRQNGADIPGSIRVQVGRLLLGYSYRLSRTTRLQFSLTAGLTDDAPDVQFATRLPISF